MAVSYAAGCPNPYHDLVRTRGVRLMPDSSNHQHPRPKVSLPDGPAGSLPPDMIKNDYAELCVTTNFTFLTGASHPEEYMVKATELGLAAIAIADVNSLAGVVRAFSARKVLMREARERGVEIRIPRLIVGARLVLDDSDVSWVALPIDRSAYERLTRLLTLGKRRTEKGQCLLYKNDLAEWGKGMVLIALPPRQGVDIERVLPQLHHVARHFPTMCFLGAVP